MCGRFTLRTPAPVLAKLFRVQSMPETRPRYNIAPTQQVPIIRIGHNADGHDGGGEQVPERECVSMRWGLIPSWAKDPSIGNRLINARSETAAEKPSFRAAWKRRRCLVPADGFYEWQRVGKQRLPFLIRMRDGQPFAMAGLWECWRGEAKGSAEGATPGAAGLLTFTVLTTSANPHMATLHDRMPVILDPSDWDTWLNPAETVDHNMSRLHDLMQPYAKKNIELEPVSTYVNDARHEGPECLATREKS